MLKPPSPLEELVERVRNNPDAKWGFVIYRCTYRDDAAWEQFMQRLKLQARLNLEADGAGDIFAHIDWNVQEDPAMLDNARALDVKMYGTFPYLDENFLSIQLGSSKR